MKIEEIPTPATIVDLDILERNILTMAEYCKSVKSGLRPHCKAHKNPLIARKQLEAGAIGLCCQTLEEAEALIFNGIESEVLLTNIIVSDIAMDRFLALRKNGNITITLDNLENGQRLAKFARSRDLVVDFLVEMNVGQNRTGVEPKEAPSLALALSRVEGLRFRGFMGYEGHLQIKYPSFDERKKVDYEALTPLTKALDESKKLGLDPEIVTSGGTGTYNIAAEIPGITEIQPGSYVVMDSRYNLIENLSSTFHNSLFLLTSVVSAPSRERVIVDMGWKACSLEYQILGYDGMPKPVGLEGISYWPAGDEHGTLKVDPNSPSLSIGERLKFIPSHCDTTLNLYGKFYGMRGDRVETICPVARR